MQYEKREIKTRSLAATVEALALHARSSDMTLKSLERRKAQGAAPKLSARRVSSPS
jgi:hypothetical protein